MEGLWRALTWYVTDGSSGRSVFGKQVRGGGQDSGLGSQSDLHKSVHQFGIDCFAQQNQPTSIRFRVRQTVYLGKVSKWINFSILGEVVFGTGAQAQLLLVVAERRLLSLWSLLMLSLCPAGVVVTVAPVDIANYVLL